MITFNAIFFDFDGVLVDSTRIKTNAYRTLFEYAENEDVEKIVAYHQQHGGISRVDKIIYAHEHILGTPHSADLIQRDTAHYSKLVFDAVVATPWIPGAEEFVLKYHQVVPMYVISGTPENELRAVMRERGMDRYFSEILGSPTKKPKHIRSLASKYGLDTADCVFVGDALTDYHAAKETGMNFIGIRSEVDFPAGTIVLPDCRALSEAIAAIES